MITTCDKCNGTGVLISEERPHPHLEPCKFCGNDGSVLRLIYDWYGAANRREYYVRCSKCGAILQASQSIKDDTKMDVVDLWNSKPEK